MKKILDFIKRIFRDETVILKSVDIELLIQREYPTCKIVLYDDEYIAYPEYKIRSFLEYDNLDKQKWVKNFNDCDDFARKLIARFKDRLLGCPVGFVIIRKPNKEIHTMVLTIDNYKNIFLIEPQNDNIIRDNKLDVLEVLM